jgi:hypothetical protein
MSYNRGVVSEQITRLHKSVRGHLCCQNLRHYLLVCLQLTSTHLRTEMNRHRRPLVSSSGMRQVFLICYCFLRRNRPMVSEGKTKRIPLNRAPAIDQTKSVTGCLFTSICRLSHTWREIISVCMSAYITGLN